MSHFLDRLTYFRRDQETFSGGHGITTRESRKWEDAYRKRWAADKIVRSTMKTSWNRNVLTVSFSEQKKHE